MKKHGKRISVLALAAFAVVAIFTMAVSTMAWFTLVSPPTTSMVTGSADVNITNVTGYKIQETRKSNGYVDYDNEIVTEKEIGKEDIHTTDNVDLAEEDLNFDVPNQGIGYYAVVPNSSGTYKFTISESNFVKFTEYNHGTVMSAEMDLRTTTPFRIRSYQMKNHKTDLQTIDVGSVGGGATLSDKLITVPSNGHYKIWFDSANKNAGVERLGDIVQSLGKNPTVRALSTSGGQTIWLKTNSDWRTAYAKSVLDVYTGSTHSWTEMTRDGETDYYYATIPSGSWTNIIFVRVNPEWVSSDGVKWDRRWNQTDNLSFPTGTDNCYTVTSYGPSGSWSSYRYAQVKVGTGSYTDMLFTDGEWRYTIASNVDDGTALAFRVGGTGISVTRTADGASLPSVNNFVESGSKIAHGGSNLVVYLHTDYSVWVTTVSEAKVKIGSGSYQAMQYDSTKTEWYYTASSVANNSNLSFTFSGVDISVSKDSDSTAPWYSKNNFNGTKILRGASSLTIYLHADHTVWVDCVVEIRTGSNAWVRMLDNPSNDAELYASGMDVTALETVSMQVNGSAYTDFSYDTGANNNVDSNKKIVKTATGVSMFLKKAAKTLWVEGNKTYTLTVGGVDKGELVYQGSGDYSGWMGTTGITVTAGSVVVKLNGTTQTVTKDTSVSNNNLSNSNPLTILRAGTVSVYYNTSNNKMVVTPVYSIKIGSTDVVATLVSGTTYQATFASGILGEASVTAYANTTTLSYAAEADRDAGATKNNCYGNAGSVKVIYDVGESVTASFDTSTSKLWVDGYAPCYYVKVGNGEYQKMTDNGDGSQVYATISADAGDTLYFRKNASGTSYDSSVSAKDSLYLNNLDGKDVITTISSKKIYLDYTTNKVWVPGRTLTYHFYNSATNTYAYAWEQNSNPFRENASYPGVLMTNDGDDIHSYTFTVHQDYVYNRLIFNLGSSANESIDIDISSNDYEGKYIYFTSRNDQNKFQIEAYDYAPSKRSDVKMYVHDSSNAQFGTNAHLYAWDTNGSYMPLAPWPGQEMTTIVPGSLWTSSISNAYSRLKFANSDGTKQTDEIDFLSHNNGLFVTTGTSNNVVSGAWTTAKAASSSVAKIFVNNVEKATMSIGDCVDNNDFIYELGLKAYHGNTLKVVVDGSTTYKDSSNFVEDDVERPYLNITNSSITVNLSAVGESARFNFYITTSGELAIVMVPDLGNGFYIMPYVNSTEGFVGAKKMNSTTSTSAMYAGWYAEKNDRIFIRSYCDAVDNSYTLSSRVAATTATADESGKIITFQKTAYFTIEVSGGEIFINEFTIADFLHLNRLERTKATSQAAILGMHTALVLQVEFTTTANKFSMYPEISGSNDNPIYVGVAVAFVHAASKPAAPYSYMTNASRYYYNSTTNPNGLTARGSSFALSDQTFLTVKNDSTKKYYAYILVDYVYSASIATMPYELNGNINFYLRMITA